MKTLIFVFSLVCVLIIAPTQASVILQYHHVSDSTPSSTSISPAQFEQHMQYLADNGFAVVPLSDIVNAIKQQQTLKDKTVAITFDDAYLDILTNGKPILDRFGYPYTVFVNAGPVERQQKNYLSWQQLKQMADDGAIIANHGYEHDSLTRTPKAMDEGKWLAEYEHSLERSEQLIKRHTGKSWRYFAYPYGEFTPQIQQWLKQNNYTGFSQQSGAVGLATDLTIVPRFPASQPYDKLAGLRDKLNSLPFTMLLNGKNAETTFNYQQVKSVTFDVISDDFHQKQLNCYISGLGKQKVNWLSDNQFSIEFSGDLPVGRVRCNCTAPSISKSGRYYWYSKPWFILNENGEWYPF